MAARRSLSALDRGALLSMKWTKRACTPVTAGAAPCNWARRRWLRKADRALEPGSINMMRVLVDAATLLVKSRTHAMALRRFPLGRHYTASHHVASCSAPWHAVASCRSPALGAAAELAYRAVSRLAPWRRYRFIPFLPARRCKRTAKPAPRTPPRPAAS